MFLWKQLLFGYYLKQIKYTMWKMHSHIMLSLAVHIVTIEV